MNITNVHDFSKTLGISFSSLGLFQPIHKFHDFSRFFYDRTNPVWKSLNEDETYLNKKKEKKKKLLCSE